MRVQFTVEFDVEDHEGLKAALEEIPGCIRATQTSAAGSRDPEFPNSRISAIGGLGKVILAWFSGTRMGGTCLFLSP